MKYSIKVWQCDEIRGFVKSWVGKLWQVGREDLVVVSPLGFFGAGRAGRTAMVSPTTKQPASKQASKQAQKQANKLEQNPEITCKHKVKGSLAIATVLRIRYRKGLERNSNIEDSSESSASRAFLACINERQDDRQDEEQKRKQASKQASRQAQKQARTLNSNRIPKSLANTK